MTEFLGIPISNVLISQIVVSIVVIAAYQFFSSLGEAEARVMGVRETLVLLDTILDRQVVAISDLVQPKQDKSSEFKDINSVQLGLKTLRETGELPPLNGTQRIRSTIADGVIFLPILVFSPIVAFWLLIGDILEKAQYRRLWIIYHTIHRTKEFAQGSTILAANLLLIGVGVLVIAPHSMSWGVALIVVASVAIIPSLAYLLFLTWWQMSWKSFWQAECLARMARSATEGQNDLFVRAMGLKNYVAAQPDVPMPGNLRFYVVLYTAVQVLILFVSQHF